jgi:photosystem II stability/assembly factor-like uncharacterized protein
MRSIKWASRRVAFCGTLDSSFYRSTDGGETWTDIHPRIGTYIPGVCGISAPDSATIYATGVFYGNAFLIKSTDAGNSWTYTDMAPYAEGLVEVHFINKQEGFVSGIANQPVNGGILLYTNNGGQTWQQRAQTILAGEYIWKIQTPDNKNFFASVESGITSSNTRALKSADGGRTWNVMVVRNAYDRLQAIGFIDSLRGWTGGNTYLYETKNGGRTWDTSRVGNAYNRFQKVNDTLAFLSGALIYKYTDTTQRYIDLDPYDEVHALRLYPNPAAKELSIRVGYDVATNAILYIVNASGKHMREVFRGRADKGKITYRTNVEGWPRGVYYVVLHTNEGKIVRDFVR